jgi:hypothetical protein
MKASFAACGGKKLRKKVKANNDKKMSMLEAIQNGQQLKSNLLKI